MFKSMTTRITVTMTLMTFICLSILTVISYFELKNSVERQMENDGRTLTSTIKREISSYNVTDLAEIQKIFIGVKKESSGNIVYLSLSDNKSNIILSDTSKVDVDTPDSSTVESNADAVSSASTTEDASVALKENETTGSILTTSDGEKVYNISAPFIYDAKTTGTLNVGISLAGMYNQISNTLMTILVIALIIELITILVALFVSKTLTKPITNIVYKLDDFAKGDFTISFYNKNRDEINKLTSTLNSTVLMLKNAIESVKGTIEKMYGLASELTESGQEASVSSEEIAQAIGSVAVEIAEENSNISSILQSLEMFGGKIDSVLKQTENVLASNIKIKDTAVVGQLKLGELVKSIDDVRVSFNSATKDIISLNDDVCEIVKITEVINSVAEQTNLLALNAAIESARAGEAGRGFSVVSDEIRKLAEKVMSSSKNIDHLIKNITLNAQTVVNNSSAISQKMDNQKMITEETVSSLDKISIEVDETLISIEDVCGSSKDLFVKKEEIITNIGEISGISGEVSSASQQISASVQNQSVNVQRLSTLASELDELADKLKQDMGAFKV